MSLVEKAKAWDARRRMSNGASLPITEPVVIEQHLFDPEFEDTDETSWWSQRRTIIVVDNFGATLDEQWRYTPESSVRYRSREAEVPPAEDFSEWEFDAEREHEAPPTLDWEGVLQFLGGLETWLDAVAMEASSDVG